MLSTAELSAMRTEAEKVLDQTCTIQILTRVSDGMGSSSESWADAYTEVGCRLYPLRTRRLAEFSYERIRYTNLWGLHVKNGQVVNVGGRVVLGTNTYEVLGVQDDHQWLLLKTVILTKLE